MQTSQRLKIIICWQKKGSSFRMKMSGSGGIYWRSVAGGNTKFQPQDLDTINAYCLPELKKPEADELVVLMDDGVKITPHGKNFIRNICSAFDLYIQKNKAVNEKKIFSRAI